MPFKTKNVFFILPINFLFFFNKVLVKRDLFSTIFFLKDTLNVCFLNSYSLFCTNLVLLNLFCFFISKLYMFISYYEYKFIKNFSSVSTFMLNALTNCIKVVSYGFYSSFQLLGTRYRQRWFRSHQVLAYTFGFNQKVWFKCPQTFVSFARKVGKKKRSYFYFSFFKKDIIKLLNQVYSLKPFSVYTGIGINVKTNPMSLKEGKKSLW